MLTIAFVLCAMQAMAYASPLVQEAGTPIALSKRQLSIDDIVDVDTLNALLQTVESKFQNGFDAYRKNTGETHPLDTSTGVLNVTRRDTGADPLTIQNGGQLWQGAISVGTPPVSYTVDFDTGSSDLFLPGPACTSNCKGHKAYAPSGSSTAADRKQTFKLSYGDGSSVSGEQYYDTVAIAGLTAAKQVLGAATTYSTGFSAQNFPPDGLLGMGYQSISVYNSPPVFASLVSQEQTKQPVFGMKLAKSGSELYLGGVNSKLYTGDFTYTPVTTKGYWQVLLQAVSVNGKASPVKNIQSIVDSGTTLIVGDTKNVKAFYAAIPGSKDASKTVGAGYYTVPCSSIPTVSFTYGSKAFNVAPALFNLGLVNKGSKDCVGAIVASDFSFWIVGDVFMQNVYTAFDMGNNRVGFATLK